VTVSEFTLYRVEDGKFAEVWDFTDMDAVMRQIGPHGAQSTGRDHVVPFGWSARHPT